jgi:3-phenylpropionate/trans-cinnamate dioxygenase ferredoxin reductase component
LHDPIVIVGGGPAAAGAADSLRREGYQSGILIAGDEPSAPYDRPILSKAFLTSVVQDGTFDLLPPNWYQDNGVTLRTGARVEHVRLAPKDIRLASGETIRYSKLILATGGRARSLPGSPLGSQVHHIRNVSDAKRLRGELGTGHHLLIIGAGFLGGEIASSARSLGTEVTMIEGLDLPLKRVLGPTLGSLFAEIHREQGVRLLTSVTPASVERLASHFHVTLSDRTHIECDSVVVAIGMAPNMELAQAAGIECDNGILVDESCKTSADDVFAAGDVARHRHPLFGRLMRVEHYENALRQGALAAARALGKPVTYQDPHWFWSDQYEYNLQAVGAIDRYTEIVVRGNLSERAFTLFYLESGILVGAVGINSRHDVRRASRLISARSVVPQSVLSDPAVDLRRVVSFP